MTTTYYVSITSDVRKFLDADNSGTASTTTDIIELRMGNGTYAPSREECLLALRRFERWIVQGGLDQNGANLPLPAEAAG